ncbi:tripartite tricarboxylate transporter substrate binding protein [Pigmentiphaga sp. CHJ604]|uniref:Bug family tripartite tricarboxylate transporter substrate binding protein n=1 Tax=Pigmentiphaga sp. CHJ604 TaxID=3081984 RepID=UPI0030D4E4D6
MTILRTTLAALLALAATPPATAADFPAHPINLIVPFAAGGTTDLLARTVAGGMSRQLGQAVVVINRPGAGTVVAAQSVAKAPADGYTLLVASNATLAINPLLMKDVGYSPTDSFGHVSLLGTVPNVVVARPDAPWTTLAQALDQARERPKGLAYGSMGAGTSNHIGMELVGLQRSATLLHVPYKGSAPALVDLMGGNVDVVVDTLAATLPQVRAGKLKALAILSAKRSPLAPEIGTAQEQGAGEVDLYSWFGIVAPAGTPAPVVERLNAAVRAALADPGVAATLKQAAIEPAGSTPAGFAEFAARQRELYARIIERTRITLN